MQDLENLGGWLEKVEVGVESGHYDVNENIFSEVEVRGLNNKDIRESSFMSLMELAGNEAHSSKIMTISNFLQSREYCHHAYPSEMNKINSFKHVNCTNSP